MNESNSSLVRMGVSLAKENESLRQQLAVKDLEVMQLREVFLNMRNHFKCMRNGFNDYLFIDAEKALSQPNTGTTNHERIRNGSWKQTCIFNRANCSW